MAAGGEEGAKARRRFRNGVGAGDADGVEAEGLRLFDEPLLEAVRTAFGGGCRRAQKSRSA
jgi:hypothetical protein